MKGKPSQHWPEPKNGFLIEQIYSYDRPTPLKDGDQGLYNWAIQFFQSELGQFTPEQQYNVLSTMSSKIKSSAVIVKLLGSMRADLGPVCTCIRE